jgi:hypothetical protein
VSTQTFANTLHHTLGVPSARKLRFHAAVGLSALIGALSVPQYRCDPSRAPWCHLAGAGRALRALLAAVLLLVGSVGGDVDGVTDR